MADCIKGITIELDGDTTKLSNAVKQMLYKQKRFVASRAANLFFSDNISCYPFLSGPFNPAIFSYIFSMIIALTSEISTAQMNISIDTLGSRITGWK